MHTLAKLAQKNERDIKGSELVKFILQTVEARLDEVQDFEDFFVSNAGIRTIIVQSQSCSMRPDFSSYCD
jgi:hypothetical protein